MGPRFPEDGCVGCQPTVGDPAMFGAPLAVMGRVVVFVMIVEVVEGIWPFGEESGFSQCQQ